MDNFPPNSAKAARAAQEAEEPKRVERVTTAEAVRRKRGLGRKFKDTFIGGSAKTAVEYMVTETIIPAIQDTMIDALQGGVERLIRGETRPSHRRVPQSFDAGRFNYQSISSGPIKADPPSSAGRSISRAARSRHSFDEIIIKSLSDANEVIDRMYDVLDRYGVVSVADLYAMVGIRAEHTDVKWGWVSLKGARAARQSRSGGYLLDLPEPQPLQ